MDWSGEKEMGTLTNCLNCGAPLNSAKCSYCGTVYDLDQKIKFVGQLEDNYVTLNVYGQDVMFYIGDLEIETICGNVYRSDDGILHTSRIKPVMELKLFSVNGWGEDNDK